MVQPYPTLVSAVFGRTSRRICRCRCDPIPCYLHRSLQIKMETSSLRSRCTFMWTVRAATTLLPSTRRNR